MLFIFINGFNINEPTNANIIIGRNTAKSVFKMFCLKTKYIIINKIIKFTILLIGEGRRLFVSVPSITESVTYKIFCFLLALIFSIYK